MARTERFEKTGKPPIVLPATIHDDLRRRDFTINAMALSLDEGSCGLLLDPFNGVADLETKKLSVHPAQLFVSGRSFAPDPRASLRATGRSKSVPRPGYDAAKEGVTDHILRRRSGTKSRLCA